VPTNRSMVILTICLAVLPGTACSIELWHESSRPQADSSSNQRQLVFLPGAASAELAQSRSYTEQNSRPPPETQHESESNQPKN
jgi:hypothetical protein